MTRKTWFPWIWIVLGYILNFQYHAASYYNCRLDDCYWLSPTKIIFGALALLFCFVWFYRSETKQWSALFGLASFIAAIHLIGNGLGIVGPEGCPTIDPNCNLF